MDARAAFNVPGIGDGQLELQAAFLMTRWSTGFGMVKAAATARADAGLGRERYYVVVYAAPTASTRR